MKSLVEHLTESEASLQSLQEFLTEALANNTNLSAIVKRCMSGLDFSKLDDDNQEENAMLIIKGADEGEYKLVSATEYYDKATENDGDIVILKGDKPVYNISVKVSDDYLGDVTLGSLSKFDENGYYLLICKKAKNFKLISRKDIVNALKDGKVTLNEPEDDDKGYDVDWNGEKLTSGYFIKGSALRKL